MGERNHCGFKRGRGKENAHFTHLLIIAFKNCRGSVFDISKIAYRLIRKEKCKHRSDMLILHT